MRILSHITALAAVATVLAACSSKPAPPAPAPIPLSDSALAAIAWVDAHASTFTVSDSVPFSADERARLVALVGDARVIGLSELTEGSAQFTSIVRRMVFALAESGLRGVAIQGPMAEAMEMNRYVRTGVGDPKRIARTLGSWRFETRDMMAMIAAMRAFNASRASDQQIGFYGFEIPSAAHAVQTIVALRDSVTGPALGAWLRRQYGCVAADEDAHWGLEGRAADSTFWSSCRPIVTQAAESLSALSARLGSSPHAAEVAYAAEMAKLVQHHVTIGLRRLARQDADAEHVLFLANLLGPNAKLLLWGGDVEMGRLTLAPGTIQTGVALDSRLGARYRPIGFMVGDGTIRMRRPNNRQTGFGNGAPGLPGLSDVPLRVPSHEMYENILRKSSHDAYWLDVRSLPNDNAGSWLRGSRPARLISDLYAPELPDLFITPVELPKFFDAVFFVKHATPLKQ